MNTLIVRVEVFSVLILVLTNTGSSAQSPSCFCTSRILCQWKPYGSHPLDIAVLGLHPPCREYNHVVCCNKSEFKWYYGNDEILSRPRIDSKPGNNAQSDIKPTGRNLVRSTTEKTTVRSTTEDIAFRSTTVKVIKDVLKSDSKSNIYSKSIRNSTMHRTRNLMRKLFSVHVIVMAIAILIGIAFVISVSI